MLNWLCANWGNIIALMAVVLLCALAICSMLRDRKNGKSSCGESCGGCALEGECHPIDGKTLLEAWKKDHPSSFKPN